MNQKFLETLADISHFAGQKRYYSGDSREDIMTFIRWAKEFEEIHNCTDWCDTDYILTIESFTKDKIIAAKIFSSSI